MKNDMHLKTCALALPMALALAACTVGPDYKRPETPLPASFGEGEVAPGAPVAADWWTLYHDPVLAQLVGDAFRHNPTVARAAARIEEADARLREVGGNALPEVDGAAGAGRNKYSSKSGAPEAGNAAGGTYSKVSAGLSTQFELDFWGKLRRAREGARADALSSRAAAGSVRLTLAGMVARDYFSVRSLDAQIAVANASLKDLRESLDLAQKRVDRGASSPLDVAQARGALAAFQSEQLDLVRQRKIAGQQLALLTGKPDWQWQSPKDGAGLPAAPVAPAGLPADLVRVRPDVRAAEEQLKSANAAIGYTQAFKYPTFSLTGALGVESRSLSNIATSGASTWAVGANVYAPILDWGKIDAQVDQARARAKMASSDFESAVQTAYTEVAGALVDNHDLALVAHELDARLSAAQDTLSIAQKRYDAGYSPYLEVLDAQRQANEAKLAGVRQREAQLAASVQLFKALGGGWKE